MTKTATIPKPPAESTPWETLVDAALAYAKARKTTLAWASKPYGAEHREIERAMVEGLRALTDAAAAFERAVETVDA